jgi:signal transduction histidine kinase
MNAATSKSNPVTPTGIGASILITASLAVLYTILVSVAPAVRFASGNPSLHAASETAAALIALGASQLVFGRFQRSFELRDLVLSASLATSGATGIAFSLIPAIAAPEPGPLEIWATVGGRLLAASLLAVAALLPQRSLRHPRRAVARTLGICALALAAIGVAATLAGDALPSAPLRSPRALAVPLALSVLFAMAATGFARRALRTGDDLMRWLAVAAILGAFARLDYFLYPSLYSPWFYTGDVLRSGFFLALLIGGALELRRNQRDLAKAAVLADRQRMARELHDGVAQDLAFIVQQGRRLGREPHAAPAIERITVAAQRALDESRHAITALVRPHDQTLSDALAAITQEAAERDGRSVDLEIADGVTVPALTQEALLRVAREAVLNAVRHGDASRIRIELQDGPELRLCISDDGRGFDVAAPTTAGSRGIVGMAERVRAIQGELQIDSQPGRGTRVTVTVP